MKKMSLEKILAENMLRFGTKNLGDTVNKVKRLVEALGAGDGVGQGVVIPADVLALIQEVGPTCTAYKNALQSTKAMNIPIICNGTIIDAIIYGAVKGNAAQLGTGALLKAFGLKKQFNKKLKQILDGLPSDSLGFYDVGKISFNPYPADPTKVATLVEITATMGKSGEEQAGSDYTELLKYLNTYNLLNCINTKWVRDGVQQYVLNRFDGSDGSGGSKDEQGFLDLDAGPALYAYADICFYATRAAGVSKAGKQVTKSKFVPIAGDKQNVPIDKDTFPKGTVTVNDAGWSKISDALTGFQSDPKFGGAGWKITGLQVNTAASLGEKVVGTIDQFSTKTGVSVADLAKAGITATNVADPAGLSAGPAQPGRSGQDFLAITRANNIKAKLEAAVPGIPITTNPQLATGAAEGRFGGVTFTVMGPNREISIPAEMASTGKIGTAQDLSKVFNCYQVDSNYNLASMFAFKDAFELGTTRLGQSSDPIRN